jgi:hypothetical protein
MNITVFTGNQPRHISLIEALGRVADQVYAVEECNTIFPGRVDDFHRKPDVMKTYFSRVQGAEAEVFGRPRFPSAPVRQFCMKAGDLSLVDLSSFKEALRADLFVVFGASYIKGPLADALIERRALNIHMGVSPYYRGSACNFWALRDGRPDLVGATVHRLSKGLDSGPMLFHSFPPAEPVSGFVLGMKAVRSAHEGLIHYLKNDRLASMAPLPQDRTLEIRYSRNSEFTDEVASDYLDREPSAESIWGALKNRDMSKFLNPFIPSC